MERVNQPTVMTAQAVAYKVRDPAAKVRHRPRAMSDMNRNPRHTQGEPADRLPSGKWNRPESASTGVVAVRLTAVRLR